MIFNFFLNNYSNKDFNELPIVDYQTDKTWNNFKSKDQNGLPSADFKSSQDSLISYKVLLEENEGPVNKNFNGLINVNQTISEDLQFAAYNIYIGLRQTVYLSRDQKVLNYAYTWDQRFLGCIQLNRLSELRDDVIDLVDIFCSDYLTANQNKNFEPETI